jgi:hypothetical protein
VRDCACLEKTKRWERKMEKWLDIGAALFAIAAAVFWFTSAYGELPPIVTYWGQAPASDPFYSAVKFSAEMNRWAALLSGLSASCMGLKLFLPWTGS